MVNNEMDHLQRIRDLIRTGETADLDHWGDGKFVLGENGEWHYEGFVNLLQAVHEAMRAVDPSVPPGLPSHCLDPEVIAKFFRISLKDMNWQGAAPQIEEKLDRILANTEALVGQKAPSPATLPPVGSPALTKKEVARQFQISTRTVDRWRS